MSQSFSVGLNNAAESLIKSHHYSRRMPANIQCCVTWHDAGGLFGHTGIARAACLFSIPPTRWSEDVWELSRLVRDNTLNLPVSQLVSFSVRWIKKHSNIGLLVSFADKTQGHHGGIYQACSWNYAGKRERQMDGILLDGVFIPGRSCNSRWGTRSPEKLTKIIGRTVLPHFDEGKHLYWVAYGKAGKAKANRLNLERLPYPKPRLIDSLDQQDCQ